MTPAPPQPPPPPPGVLYTNEYVWLVFVSALDIMVTWIILWSGGREVNALAEAVIHHFGLIGLVFFKPAIVFGVVILSEVIGRPRRIGGRRFARAAVALSAPPVLVGLALLLRHFHR